MKTRFFFDILIAKSATAIFVVSLLAMIGISFLTERFFTNIFLFVIVGALIVIFWIFFTRGSYITVDEKNVYGRIFFLRGKVTPIKDIISIHRRRTFAGLMAEIYMKVRTKEGTISERGLVGVPGLKKSDLKELLKIIRSINPSIRIDSIF